VAMVRSMARFRLDDGREIGVRSAVSADARSLKSLLDQVGGEPRVTILHEPGSRTARWLRGQIAAAAAQPVELMLVAVLEGRLVGHLALVADQRPYSHHVCELGIAVSSAERGLGVGSALLDVALPWAARHGLRKAVVGVLAHNGRALHFFATHGFAREGLRAGQYLLAGVSYDEVIMARLLAADAGGGR
jgi:RimJ/RimL family protein N-acetyltransferase